MNTATQSKRFGAVAAAIVLTGGLTVASASAANAAYPDAPTVSVKVSAPSTLTVGKAKAISIKTVKGAKVVITYGKSKAKATTSKVKSTTAKSTKSTKYKVTIKKTGTYYIKIVVKAAGKATKTTYIKVKVKK